MDDLQGPDILIHKAIPKAKAVGASVLCLLRHTLVPLIRWNGEAQHDSVEIYSSYPKFFQRLHVFQKHSLTLLSECLCRSQKAAIFPVNSPLLKKGELTSLPQKFSSDCDKTDFAQIIWDSRNPLQQRNRCDQG